MAALGAISTDIYLPNLPEVQSDLHSTAAAAQFTMTAMLIGNGLGQLIIGSASDRFGRRRPVLIGVSLHIVVSILCALAASMTPLIVLRGFQGFFNASAGVVASASATASAARVNRLRPFSAAGFSACAPLPRPPRAARAGGSSVSGTSTPSRRS
ncbi:MAG: MFS transporter [Promicromonosporaceae bacterium]|nr:MFS transporter [Promicromonosporaceae bacterium]